MNTASKNTGEVILGSFVMAGAISRYLLKLNPDTVTLVAMGDRGQRPTPEDEACADYLEHLLTGKEYDPIKVFCEVIFQETTQKFVRGEKEYLPREDPIFCLQRDIFDSVLGAKKSRRFLEVKKLH